MSCQNVLGEGCHILSLSPMIVRSLTAWSCEDLVHTVNCGSVVDCSAAGVCYLQFSQSFCFSFWWFLSIADWNYDVTFPFRAGHYIAFYSLHGVWLLVCILIITYCKNKVFPIQIERYTIYEDKNLLSPLRRMCWKAFKYLGFGPIRKTASFSFSKFLLTT